MRPDEHKQKKSRQYQAKQAAKGKAPPQGPESKDAENGKGKKPQQNTGKKAQTVPDKRTEQQPATNQPGPSRVPNVEEEGEERRSFARRKIESNTYRYENEQVVDSDEELVVDEHGSLRALLQDAGPLDVSARFQLQDEREWEDRIEDDGPLHLLAVDCGDLARALRCIPLTERLGLHTSFFEPEVLRHQQQQADENMQAWLVAHRRTEIDTPPAKSVGSKIDTETTGPTLQPHVEDVIVEPPPPPARTPTHPHTAKQSTHVIPPQQPQTQPPPPTQTHPQAHAHTPAHTPIPTPATAQQASLSTTNTNQVELEDDLDALLGIEPVAKVASSVGNTKTQGGLLDSFPLPTLPSTTAPIAHVPPSATVIVGGGLGQQKNEWAKTDDLEDWLDSVLDD